MFFYLSNSKVFLFLSVFYIIVCGIGIFISLEDRYEKFIEFKCIEYEL